jgi:hypothetical protein
MLYHHIAPNQAQMGENRVGEFTTCIFSMQWNLPVSYELLITIPKADRACKPSRTQDCRDMLALREIF